MCLTWRKYLDTTSTFWINRSPILRDGKDDLNEIQTFVINIFIFKPIFLHNIHSTKKLYCASKGDN